MAELESPYPYAGGKRKVSELIWERFGHDVPNFIDAFCGSNAILLGRPGASALFERPGGAGKIETVNDIDGGIVNFWRAIAYGDEQKVAQWCDWPVSELDMHARHTWLVNRLEEMTPKLREDPYFFDEQVAGWWCWGIAIWIGTGWCATPKRQKPYTSGTGTGKRGVHSVTNHKRPELLSAGRGVHRTHLQKPRPEVHPSGVMGLKHNKPSLGNDRGIHGVAAPPAEEWFRALKERTRGLRILCGDFRRLLTPSVLGFGKNVGGRRPTAVMLDPPYDPELRMKHIYNNDDPDTWSAARQWALENGENPDLRIALCGYEDGTEMPGWECVSWKPNRGFAGPNNMNRLKERIWFSPHCLRPLKQKTLFD